MHALSLQSKIFLYSSLILLLIVHLLLSFCLRDFAWLAAFGALLTVCGLLSSFSFALPVEDIDQRDLEETKEGDHYVHGGAPLGAAITDKETIDKIKQSNINDIMKKYESMFTYVLFVIVGTVIWAYAGFLNVFFK